MVEAARDQVLITRPGPAAAATADQVTARGFQPVLAPLLRIRGLDAALPAAADAVLVTSGNAVPALAAFSHLPLLAVGEATARQASEAGFANVRSADGDAGALAALARRSLPAGARLLLASGRGQGAALAAALRADGFRVLRRAVYAAVPAGRLPRAAADALRGNRLHAALFLSAETARAFARLLPAGLAEVLPGVQALAIGQAAADALSPLPWGRVLVSRRPTLDDVLALL